MKLAVLSDVHGNLAALVAVLADVRGREVGEKVFLGDAVGYGPEPDEVTALLGRECGAFVAGNHDWAVLGLTDIGYFNPVARAAIEWTGRRISPGTREALRACPLKKVLRKHDMLLVHSTPREPERWDYLFSALDAALVFPDFEQRICMVGHSHVPFVAELRADGSACAHRDGTGLREGSRYVINAGSVGQPRDGEPRAAYALFEDDAVRIVRVPYDIGSTQRKMAEAGLPEPLIERLGRGM